MAQDKNKQPQNKGGIKIAKDGPYLVSGNLPLKKEIIVADENGDSSAWEKGKEYPGQEGKYALCRCGHSKNKPFCDGSHLKAGFDGTETASKENYSDQCEKISGPELDLADVPDLCARARFCHNQYNDVWSNTQGSDDPDLKKNAVKQACNCPSGRLVAINKKTGEPIEPGFEQSISLVEDPAKKVSGPIWAKGGVSIESADGTKYEARNRVTLCRCGKSRNKPFCDGCHIDNGFNDGDANLGLTE